jgi:hypothetical protein
VSFEFEGEPEQLVDCNCSICRRLAALWAHADSSRITVRAEPEATLAYLQGDRSLAMHTCRSCGCTTHWQSLGDEKPRPMAVNFRLCDPESIAHLRIRRFDGADTWRFLDD